MLNQFTINQSAKVAFTSTGLTTGLTTFSGVHILKNGVSYSLTLTYSEIGNGLYVATFTPTETGLYSLFIEGTIYTFEVVSRDLNTILRNLEDEAIGSWEWNKLTGDLTLLRQDSGTLATFRVLDSADSASRERLT